MAENDRIPEDVTIDSTPPVTEGAADTTKAFESPLQYPSASRIEADDSARRRVKVKRKDVPKILWRMVFGSFIIASMGLIMSLVIRCTDAAIAMFAWEGLLFIVFSVALCVIGSGESFRPGPRLRSMGLRAAMEFFVILRIVSFLLAMVTVFHGMYRVGWPRDEPKETPLSNVARDKGEGPPAVPPIMERMKRQVVAETNVTGDIPFTESVTVPVITSQSVKYYNYEHWSRWDWTGMWNIAAGFSAMIGDGLMLEKILVFLYDI